MPDKWGRPIMSDWMQLASTMESIDASQTASELNKAKITGIERGVEQEEAVKKHGKGIMEMGEEGYKKHLKKNPDLVKDPKAVQTAFSDNLKLATESEQFKVAKMETMRKSNAAAFENTNIAIKKAETLLAAGDEVNGMASYYKAYDFVNDGIKIISIDHQEGTMVVENLDGSETVQDLPSLDELRKLSGKYMNKEAFSKLGVMNREEINFHNQQMIDEGEKNLFTDGKGGEVLVVKQLHDPNNTNLVSTKYIDKKNNKEITREEFMKGDYHSQKYRKEEAEIERKAANAAYVRGGKQGKDTTWDKKVKHVMAKYPDMGKVEAEDFLMASEQVMKTQGSDKSAYYRELYLLNPNSKHYKRDLAALRDKYSLTGYFEAAEKVKFYTSQGGKETPVAEPVKKKSDKIDYKKQPEFMDTSKGKAKLAPDGNYYLKIDGKTVKWNKPK